MATKTANLNMRIEGWKKADAEQLFEELGMTLPQAINMFISQSLLVGGLPFEVKHPRYNRETEAAMQEANDILSGKVETKSYNSAEELFKELDKD